MKISSINWLNSVYKVSGDSDIELWVADKEDEKNLDLLKSEASKNGADALIDLYRKPINTSKQNAPPYGQYAISEFGIGGYLYYAKLVIKKK